jgi:hypothetical protein
MRLLMLSVAFGLLNRNNQQRIKNNEIISEKKNRFHKLNSYNLHYSFHCKLTRLERGLRM